MCIIVTFLVSLLATYLLVGYCKNAVLTKIHWVANVTVRQKLREYYIRTFPENIIPTLIIAAIPTILVFAVTVFKRKKKQA